MRMNGQQLRDNQPSKYSTAFILYQIKSFAVNLFVELEKLNPKNTFT